MTARSQLPETNRQSRQRAQDGWLVGWTTTEIVGWFPLPSYATVGLRPKSVDARIECPADWDLGYLRGSRSKALVTARAQRLLADHGGPAATQPLVAKSELVAASLMRVFITCLLKAIRALVKPT